MVLFSLFLQHNPDSTEKDMDVPVGEDFCIWVRDGGVAAPFTNKEFAFGDVITEGIHSSDYNEVIKIRRRT